MGLFSKNSSSSTTVLQTTTNTNDLSNSVASLGIAGSTVNGGVYSVYTPINLQIGDSAIASNPQSNPTVSVPTNNPTTAGVANNLIDTLTNSTTLHSFLLYGIIGLIILHFLK